MTAAAPRFNLLLVEDSPSDAGMIDAILSEAGETPFDLFCAETLADAIQVVEKSDYNVDVILLDLNLPDSSGLETFAAASKAAPNLPIVVLSADEDWHMALEAVRHGAQDYLIKLDLDGDALARSLLYSIERTERRRAERELNLARDQLLIARRVQQRLFPTEDPAIDGFDIAGACYPAEGTSGDYYDYIPLSGGGLGLVVGDVAGHGLGPALLMSETRAFLRALAESHDDVGEVLSRANGLLNHDMHGGDFVTLFFARLDPIERSFVYASAGHPGFLIESSGEARVLESTGIVLGFQHPEIIERAGPIPLAAGDVLLMASDGIHETLNPRNEEFGIERMCNVVRNHIAATSSDIITALYQAVHDHSQGCPQRDDITAVVVKAQ